MAIIIQDMNMPAQCWECPFHFRLDNAHAACSRKPMEDAVEDGDERPKYCPLEELEEPFEEVLRKVHQNNEENIGMIKILNASFELSVRQMLDIAHEAYREMVEFEIKSLSHTDSIYVRYELENNLIKWFKVTVIPGIKLSDTYIVIDNASDEEVMQRGCSMSKVQGS